ncbi:MAG: hypothetical protein WBH58_08730 [Bacteroidales bacterium]|jgi:hypothetical protein|nr:hypothetical protein [Bacteroidales bacterium]MDI9575879.1 hypothetical protein [Bacteroidota bacterium]
MKKLIFSLLSIVVIVIIAITSCKKPDEVINPNLNKMSLGLFDINPNIITLSEGIDQKSIKALPLCAASDIAGAGYSAVIAKMELKTILIGIVSGIIGGLLAELTVNRIYKNKNKKKNKR